MKTLITILFLFAATAITPAAYGANSGGAQNTVTVSANNTKNTRDALVQRVYEIRDMNFGTLNAEQKEQLRAELLGIKKKMGDPNFTGLYLSSGVIIIILIVLLVLALGKD